jgi:hypothetical protein
MAQLPIAREGCARNNTPTTLSGTAEAIAPQVNFFIYDPIQPTVATTTDIFFLFKRAARTFCRLWGDRLLGRRRKRNAAATV